MTYTCTLKCTLTAADGSYVGSTCHTLQDIIICRPNVMPQLVLIHAVLLMIVSLYAISDKGRHFKTCRYGQIGSFQHHSYLNLHCNSCTCFTAPQQFDVTNKIHHCLKIFCRALFPALTKVFTAIQELTRADTHKKKVEVIIAEATLVSEGFSFSIGLAHHVGVFP